MPRIIQDEEIKTLLAEPKPIPSFWRSRLELKRKANEAHAESAFVFEVESGHVFSIRIRAARDNARDFSVILSLLEGGAEYVLIRHNGRHKSAHTNLIEYAAESRTADLVTFATYIKPLSATRDMVKFTALRSRQRCILIDGKRRRKW